MLNVLADRPVLVPLTTSLYVPGKLADSGKVIVDVGTGFYVEKVGGDSRPTAPHSDDINLNG